MVDTAKVEKTLRLKVFIIGIFFFLFYLVVVFRSYQLQILGNAKVTQLVKTQHRTNLIMTPQRGTIFDRNGEILALDVLTASIGIHPHLIENKTEALKLLKKYTTVSEKNLTKKLTSTKKFEWIQRRIPLPHGKAIDEQDLAGIQIVNEYRRFYPNKELAGQLLGAVGYDAKALGGLELAYDNYLHSSLKKKKAERDARGKYFSAPDQNEEIHDIYLTIDKNVQSFAENALKQAASKHQAKSGFVLVTDIQTGEILGMANYPSFNPNAYWKYSQPYWKNHSVIDVFEPGSTFKTILMAAALDSKTIKPNDKFFCENGKYRVGKNIINDHNGHGWLTAKQILQVSSNIGMTKIVQKLGRKKFYEYIKALGFGEKVNLGLGGESPGMLRNYKNWKDIDLSNIGFGQGISVNGLQMAAAYGSIANGGQHIKPSLIKWIVDQKNTTVVDNTNHEEKSVLSEETARNLREMLHMVTQEGGTATLAHIPGYLSAGKTGTAQKFDPQLKTYAPHDYVSSFIGFAPQENPRLLVYAVFDTPRKNGYYGGTVAGPVFKEVAERSLKYLGESPVQQTQTVLAHTQKIESHETERTQQALVTIENQKAPDLTGFTLRKVMQVMKKHQGNIRVQGSGIVVKQSPTQGTPWNNNTDMTLVLQEKT